MNTKWSNNDRVLDVTGEQLGVVPKTFVSNVMVLMSLALLISGVAAYMFGTSDSLKSLLYNAESGMTTLGWVVMIAPLGMVLLLGAGVRKMSSSSLILTFVVFAALMGISLSSIFEIYSLDY